MKKIYIGLGVLIIIISAVAVGGGFWYYTESKAITEEMNQTLETVNQSSTQSSDLQNQITESVLKLSERAEYEQTLQDLESLIPISQEFVNQSQSRLDQISANPHSQNQELVEIAKTSLNVHTDSLASSLEVAEFSKCIATNLDTQFTWMSQLGQDWEATDETTAELTFVQLNRQTATKLRSNVDTAPRIRDCFAGKYADLFTLEFENSMKQDVKIYQNMADSLDKLANSVERFDRNNFLAAKDEISATLSVQSTFIGDTQLKIRDAIDKVSSENASQMQFQVEQLQRSKNDVERKWWL